MKLIIALGIIAKLASVSGDCDVEKTIHDFDFNKFTGGWFFTYHLGTEDDDDDLDYLTDYYDVPDGNGSRITTRFYDKKVRRNEILYGYVREWDNTGYSLEYDTKSSWDSRTYILAVDYDGYFIGKDCPASSDEWSIYVSFRRPHPDEATLEDVKKALRDNNIDFSQLKKWRTA